MIMNDLHDNIQKAKALLDQAWSIFVITGAGISAESGVPTFRSPGGLWNKVDPMKVATPEAFQRDPESVWKWYDQRRTELKDLAPNPGHYALAELEKKVERFFLLTQNVDDLHEKAGSHQLAHIHGRIWEVRCTKTGKVRELFEAPLEELPPRNPKTGAPERPNVVWFGELINEDAVLQTEQFLSDGEVDIVLVVGTEASFPYIQEWILRGRGVRQALIEINIGETDVTQVADLHLRGPSGEILPQIVGLPNG